MSRLVSICAIALGLFLVVVTFRLVADDSTTLPFWDQWAFVMQLAAQHGHYTFAQLWQQHNEHRIVLTRLLLLADVCWFRATGRLPLAVIVIGQLLHAGIFCLVICWLKSLDVRFRVALSGLAFAFIFSPVQLDNFVWPWQVAFILGCLFTSLCFYLFATSLEENEVELTRKAKLGPFSLSLVAAFVASLSGANGLFAWPVLVFFCFALRLNWRISVAALISAVAMITAYLFHYQSTAGHADPIASLRHPLQMLAYVVLYLGGSWASYGEYVAAGVGSVGLLAALVLLALGVVKSRFSSRFEVFCSALVIFALLTGIITASGRISLGLDQALSSRYQTFAMMFWCALCMWAVSYFTGNVTRRWSGMIVAFACLLVLVGPLLQFSAVTDPYAGRAGQWRVAEASALSEVNDRQMLTAVYPNPAEIEPALEYLRQNHMSVFAGGLDQRLGKPLTAFYYVDPHAACIGLIDEPETVYDISRSGVRLSGWAWDRVSQATLRNLVLTDENGKIRGFGVGGFAYSGKRPAAVEDTLIKWFGYVRQRPGGGKVQAYGVVADGKGVCSIATPRDIDPAPSTYGPRTAASVRLVSQGHNGVFRRGQWWLDANGDGRWSSVTDTVTNFGQSGDSPVVGDWNGSGRLRIGVFRNGRWWLDMNGDGKWTPDQDKSFTFGQAGDLPVVGDWDGSGRLRIGVFRNGQWWLDMNGDGKWTPDEDKSFTFGQAGDLPVVGDWDGSGRLRIGVFRNGQWWLDINGDNRWDAGTDKLLTFGAPHDRPVVGNWDHSGKIRVGVFRDGHWLLDLNGNGYWDGPGVDEDIIFGQTGDSASVLQWPPHFGKN